FSTSGHAGLTFEDSSGKLYVYATRTANAQAGVVCVDTVAAATTANPFCGFTPLTAANDAPNVIGFSSISLPLRVGQKLYAFNYVGNAAPGGASGTTAQNRLMCFDLQTHAACAGQPFAVDFGSAAAVTVTSPSPAANVVG